MKPIYTHTTIQVYSTMYIYTLTPNRLKSRHIQQTKLKQIQNKTNIIFCRISQQKTSADLYTIYIYIY